MLLSGSKPLLLQSSQITFFHYSHLSLEPASQQAEEVSAFLIVLRSGCWHLGCGCSPSPALSFWGLNDIRQNLLRLKLPCHEGFHFMSAVHRLRGVRVRNTERRKDATHHQTHYRFGAEIQRFGKGPEIQMLGCAY